MSRRRLHIVALIAGVIGGCYLRPAPAPGFRFACKETADCQALDCSGASISREKAATLVEGCTSVEVKADPTLGVQAHQTCMAGLCEYPCDIFTFKKDCPSSEGFTFCFNGACTNLCGSDDYTKYKYDSNDDFCTDPQTCIPFDDPEAMDDDGTDPKGIDPDALDMLGVGGGGQGGFSISTLPAGAGFCGQRCDADGALACPPGQYCTGALCLPGCDQPNATACKQGSTCIAAAGFSSCLITCDPDADAPCGVGEVCVMGLNVCQPTCIGVDKIDCADSFECDATLEICVPVGGDESSGSSGDSTT